MKRRNASALCALALLAACLPGCERHSAEPPASQPPTPTPVPADAAAERMKSKTGDALAATGDFVKEKGGQVKSSLGELADQFSKEKDSYRQKLEQEQRDLAPQIDALKERAARAGDTVRAEFNAQAAALEGQRQRAGQRLDQLKGATREGWESFKDRWRAEDTSPSKSPAPPTVTPAPAP